MRFSYQLNLNYTDCARLRTINILFAFTLPSLGKGTHTLLKNSTPDNKMTGTWKLDLFNKMHQLNVFNQTVCIARN